MRGYRRKTQSLLILVFMATPIIALTVIQSGKDPTVSKEQGQKIKRELPVVDFGAQEPTSHSVRAKHREKASRYDRYGSQIIQDAPWISGRILTTHWYRDLSALPIADSDTVVIGTVTQAQAHLSNDKTGIFSEFGVQVEEVLKDGLNFSIPVGRVISAERYGGAVRFRSGSIQRFEVNGQGMPRVGGRYLLFLKGLDQEQNFSIVTGYDVSAQTVSPLDGSVVEEGNQVFPFDKYQGLVVSAFLELVRMEIAKTKKN